MGPSSTRQSTKAKIQVIPDAAHRVPGTAKRWSMAYPAPLRVHVPCLPLIRLRNLRYGAAQMALPINLRGHKTAVLGLHVTFMDTDMALI